MDISQLRLVQISAAYVGAQKQIEDTIYNNLKNLGVESRVIYFVGESNNPDYIRCENKLENVIRRFCYKYIKKSYVFSWFQTRRVINVIKKFNPNIVHLHTIHHGYVHFPMLFDYLRKNNISIVYTVHDMWVFSGGCYHYTEIKCNGFLNECHNCPNNEKALDCNINETSLLFQTKKKCYKNQNIIFVAVSDWVKSEMNRSYLSKGRCFVIHNSIDPQEVNETPEISFDNKIIRAVKNYKSILFVAASWDKRKGFDIICELSRLLGDEYRVIMVGNVNPEIYKRAEPNMVFTGYLKQKKELQYLYRNCNLHASASKEETFGMTFVEAAFEGTKSIGFASTAIKETIEGVGGICVRENDITSFYNAICEHIDEKLSIEEIDTIKHNYSKKVMADAYVKVYKDILLGNDLH